MRVLWRVLLLGRARAELWLRAGARLQLLRDAIQVPQASDASLREAHATRCTLVSRPSCFSSVLLPLANCLPLLPLTVSRRVQDYQRRNVATRRPRLVS